MRRWGLLLCATLLLMAKTAWNFTSARSGATPRLRRVARRAEEGYNYAPIVWAVDFTVPEEETQRAAWHTWIFSMQAPDLWNTFTMILMPRVSIYTFPFQIELWYNCPSLSLFPLLVFAACTFSSFKSLLVLNISRPQDQAIEVCDLDSVWPSGSGSLDRESFRQRLRARGASSDRGIDTLFNAFTGGTYLITRFAWVCTCANTIFSIHKHYSLRAGARKIENWHSLLATSALDGQELKEKLKYGVSICFYASETLSAKFQQSIPQEALITWSKVEHLPWITRLLSADPQSCFVMPAGVMRRRRHCKLAAQAARWIPELWLVVFLVPGFKSSALGSSWMSSRFLRHTFSSVDRCFTNLGLICYQLCPDIGKIPRLYSLTACSCLEKRRWMWRARSMQALMTVCIPTSSFMFFATLIYLVHLSSVY